MNIINSILLAFALVSIPALAAPPQNHLGITTGKIYELTISVCLTKENAIAVLNATANSKLAGDEMFDSFKTCDVESVRFRAGTEMFAIETPSGKFRVIEIIDVTNEKNKLYFLTSMILFPSKQLPGAPLTQRVSKPIKVDWI